MQMKCGHAEASSAPFASSACKGDERRSSHSVTALEWGLSAQRLWLAWALLLLALAGAGNPGRPWSPVVQKSGRVADQMLSSTICPVWC